MNLLKFPTTGIQSVPDGLRKLAERIESGDFGDAHNLAWVVDCGDSLIEFGLLGKAAEPGAEFYLLTALAQHRMLEKL